jgi:hypothetical protein
MTRFAFCLCALIGSLGAAVFTIINAGVTEGATIGTFLGSIGATIFCGMFMPDRSKK